MDENAGGAGELARGLLLSIRRSLHGAGFGVGNMRTKLKVEGSVFLAKKGLEFFRTFAMKLRGEVEDQDYFNVICNSIRKEDLVRILETRIPPHQIAKLEDKKDGKIDRCGLGSSIMARYWNAPGCREVVRQILFELVADLHKMLSKPF